MSNISEYGNLTSYLGKSANKNERSKICKVLFVLGILLLSVALR